MAGWADQLMNAGFDAGKFIQADEAGQKRRTTQDVGAAASTGDYGGAAKAAFSGGQIQLGGQLLDLSNQEHARAMQEGAKALIAAAESPASWNRARAAGLAAGGQDIGRYEERDKVLAGAMQFDDYLKYHQGQQGQANSDRTYELARETANKPIQVGQGAQLYDPATKSFIAQPQPSGGGSVSNIDVDNEAKIRGEYIAGSKDYSAVRDSYSRLQAASKDTTGAGDIAMVFSFMKMLDPTSVVREGEYATAANSGGIPAQIVSLYNNALNGQKLAPPIREQFLQQGRRQFEAATDRQKSYTNTYRGLAEQYRLSPDRVTPDLSGGVQAGPPPTDQLQGGVTLQPTTDGLGARQPVGGGLVDAFGAGGAQNGQPQPQGLPAGAYIWSPDGGLAPAR